MKIFIQIAQILFSFQRRFTQRLEAMKLTESVCVCVCSKTA